MKSVLIVSGGLDSTVMAYDVAKAGWENHLLSVNYGQRHKKEIEYAALTAKKLHATHHVVDLTNITQLISGSSLTSDTPVPEGHYAAPNMAQTVVPNRNAIMLAIAFGYATNIGADKVFTGVHAGDHPIYPDCRPAFIRAFDLMEVIATDGYGHAELEAPFVYWTKKDIVALGKGLNVPFQDTWSCYQGGEIHCGRCGTCVERKEAFRLASVVDPTEYEDTAFEVEAYRGK